MWLLFEGGNNFWVVSISLCCIYKDWKSSELERTGVSALFVQLKRNLADFSSFDLSKKKSAQAYFYFVPSANREKDLGMHVAFLKKTKQIEIQTNATCACTFLKKSIY